MGGLTATAVIVSALDRNDVCALLAPVFCREQPRFKVGARIAAPLATTACEAPAIHHVPSVPFWPPRRLRGRMVV